jgi:hypothetical protein
MAKAGVLTIDIKLNAGPGIAQIKKLEQVLKQLEQKGEVNLQELVNSLNKFEAEAKQAAQATKQGLGGSVQKWGASLGGATLAIQGAIAGIRTMVNVAKDWINASDVEELAINKLNSALQLTGIYTQETSQDFQDFAADLQGITTHGNETILTGQALLTTIGRMNDPDQIKGATKAAIGLSDAMGIELKAAFTLVGKAAAGETSALTRYGIIVDDVNDLIEQGNELFQQSINLRETDAGKAMAMANTYGDLKEELGGMMKVAQSAIIDQLMPILEKAIIWMRANGETVAKVIKAIVATVTGLVKFVIGTVKQFIVTFGSVFDIAADILGTFMLVLTNTFDDIGMLFDHIGKVMLYAVTGQWDKIPHEVKKIGESINNMFDTSLGADLLKRTGENAKKIGEGFLDNMVDPLANIGEDIYNAINDPVTIVDFSAIGKKTKKKLDNSVAKELTEADIIHEAVLQYLADALDTDESEIDAILSDIEFEGKMNAAMKKRIEALAEREGISPSDFIKENEDLAQWDMLFDEPAKKVTAAVTKIDDEVKIALDDFNSLFTAIGEGAAQGEFDLSKMFGILAGIGATAVGGPFGAILGGLFGGGIPGFASGADFIVPGGFPNDTFLMGASSGEHVSVTPAGESGGGSGLSVTNVFSGIMLSDRQSMTEVARTAFQQANEDSKLFYKD